MKNITIKEMAFCAVFAALLCVLAPLSIPIGPVPISLTILVIYLAVVVIGTKYSLISYIVYLLLGLCGLPVFSGFSGGVAKLAGPTGGYLIGFILMILVGGTLYQKTTKVWLGGIYLFIGVLIDYVFGTIWFILMMDTTLSYALSVCVLPFLPVDIIKIVLAIALGTIVKNALVKANLLS